MADLSPAAQAIADAVDSAIENDLNASSHYPNPCINAKAVAAAALRAAVDQVLPPEVDLPPVAPDAGHIRQNERRLVRLRLLNIATELENTDD